MELSLEDAHTLVVKVMKNFEQNEEYANIIADHIIDCELRGLSYGGLARIPVSYTHLTLPTKA